MGVGFENYAYVYQDLSWGNCEKSKINACTDCSHLDDHKVSNGNLLEVTYISPVGISVYFL